MTMSPGRCYERRGIVGLPSAGPTKQAASLSVILHLVLDRGRANVYNVIRMKWPRSCESRARESIKKWALCYLCLAESIAHSAPYCQALHQNANVFGGRIDGEP